MSTSYNSYMWVYDCWKLSLPILVMLSLDIHPYLRLVQYLILLRRSFIIQSITLHQRINIMIITSIRVMAIRIHIHIHIHIRTRTRTRNLVACLLLPRWHPSLWVNQNHFICRTPKFIFPLYLIVHHSSPVVQMLCSKPQHLIIHSRNQHWDNPRNKLLSPVKNPNHPDSHLYPPNLWAVISNIRNALDAEERFV